MSFSNKLEMIKWIFTSITCIFSLIGIFLPKLIQSNNWVRRLDSFSGGILFASGFAHLLEDATDNIFQYGKTSYPVSGATAVATFSALTIILVFTSSKDDLNDDIDGKPTEIIAKKRSSFSLSFKQRGKNAKVQDSDNIEQELNSINDNDNSNHTHHDQDNESKEASSKNNNSKSVFEQKLVCFPIMTIVIYLIYAMNSLLEGIKLGIINTKNEFVIFILFVLARKIFESYTLSLMFLRSKPNKYIYFSALIIYSILFIAGTIMAILLKLKNNDLTFGILLSVSAGAFIYVAVSKWAVIFLNRRNWSYSDKFWNLGLFAVGIVFVILIAIASK